MGVPISFSEEGRTSKKDYTVLFVPRKTLLCEKHLQVEHMYLNYFLKKLSFFYIDVDCRNH